MSGLYYKRTGCLDFLWFILFGEAAIGGWFLVLLIVAWIAICFLPSENVIRLAEWKKKEITTAQYESLQEEAIKYQIQPTITMHFADGIIDNGEYAEITELIEREHKADQKEKLKNIINQEINLEER